MSRGMSRHKSRHMRRLMSRHMSRHKRLHKRRHRRSDSRLGPKPLRASGSKANPHPGPLSFSHGPFPIPKLYAPPKKIFSFKGRAPGPVSGVLFRKRKPAPFGLSPKEASLARNLPSPKGKRPHLALSFRPMLRRDGFAPEKPFPLDFLKL
jgi:hypothetical protein